MFVRVRVMLVGFNEKIIFGIKGIYNLVKYVSRKGNKIYLGEVIVYLFM